MEIKILGPGCPRCNQTYANVSQALAQAGLEVKVEKVTNPLEIAAFGVFGTPAVVIDGEVKVVGRVPTPQEIESWLSQ